jgi:hypothetical protein
MMRFSDWSHTILLALVLLFLGSYGVALQTKWQKHAISDFAIFYESVQSMKNGGSIYPVFNSSAYQESKETVVKPSRQHSTNLNTPFFNQLMYYGFSCFSYVKAWQYFTGISILCLFLGIFCLPPFQKSGAKKLYFLTLSLILLAYFPTYINTQYGQVGLILFFLISCAWFFLEKGCFLILGFVLGLASAIKLFLLLFIVYLFFAGLYRSLIVMIGSFVLLSVLPGWEYGFGIFKLYFQVLSEIHWYQANWNVSLFGALARIGCLPSYFFYRLLFLILGVSLSLLGYVIIFKNKASSLDKIWGFHLTLVLALLFSPLGWLYYFPILILPSLTLFETWYDLRFIGPGLLLLLALCLSAWPCFYLGASQILITKYNLLQQGLGFYTLLILIVLIVYSSCQNRVVFKPEESVIPTHFFVQACIRFWGAGIVLALLPGSLLIFHLAWVR